MRNKVTIIVPAFNRAKLIGETLNSVRDQNYPNIDLTVVDDGSTDGTAEIVSQWIATERPRQSRLVVLENNIGKSAAVNAVLNHVDGEYVMILDSDDILLPDAISLEVQFLRRVPNAGMVFAPAYIMKDHKRTGELLGTLDGDSDLFDLEQHYGDLLLRGNPIVSSTVLLRHVTVKTIGLLNINLKYTHDWEYWIRVSKKYTIGFMNQPIMYYRMNVSGASSMNRLGTFKEICLLLLDARSAKKQISLIKALIYQTKYSGRLSYHDGNPKALIGIVLFGLYSLGKFIIPKGDT